MLCNMFCCFDQHINKITVDWLWHICIFCVWSDVLSWLGGWGQKSGDVIIGQFLIVQVFFRCPPPINYHLNWFCLVFKTISVHSPFPSPSPSSPWPRTSIPSCWRGTGSCSQTSCSSSPSTCQDPGSLVEIFLWTFKKKN